jgi:peptidase T-like protein
VTGEQRLHDRFVRLCEIPSPTGEERAVADAVGAELRELGVEFTEDDAAAPAKAGAGNLIARIPGRDDRWLAFTSHLDTVPHEDPVEVVLDGGVYRSKGETILGADNKAAVTVLLELAARHASEPPPVGIELIFTVAEEDGLRGAKALDIAALRSPFGFVLDHASPIGEVIDAAPTYQRLDARFEGVEAHAGIKPEDGHSAIAAAAAAVAAMELGRLDEETTANVGIIEGGSASNIVAGQCRILGEARSIDPERAAATVGSMVDACTWAARARLRRRRAGDRDVPRLPRRSELGAGAPRDGGAGALRARAATRRDRGRQRCQCPDRLRMGMRPARQRHRRQPHPRGECPGRPPRPDAGDLRGNRRGGSEAVMALC